LHTVEFIRANHDDGVAPVQGHALRPTLLSLPHNLAETRLRILQSPTIS
jgi:hypothetical protein